MHETNLKSLDLNLLVALKALLDEKHVTRAADRIGLSQPAMSRALGRLRLMFADDLLVKGANGLCLTPRACDLYESLQFILAEIMQLVAPQSLDLAHIQKEVIIATRDYETTMLLPNVIKSISKIAPQLTFRINPLVGDDLSPLLKQEVDFIIAGSESSAATLCRSILYKENFTCLVSKENPVHKKELTLDQYLSMKHCLVTIKNTGYGIVDSYLQKNNLKRKIAVRIPHFVAAVHVVARSDLIITLPHRLSEYLAKQENAVMLKLPIKIPHFPIYLYWHIRNQNNPLSKWLRTTIRQSCK